MYILSLEKPESESSSASKVVQESGAALDFYPRVILSITLPNYIYRKYDHRLQACNLPGLLILESRKMSDLFFYHL